MSELSELPENTPRSVNTIPCNFASSKIDLQHKHVRHQIFLKYFLMLFWSTQWDCVNSQGKFLNLNCSVNRACSQINISMLAVMCGWQVVDGDWVQFRNYRENTSVTYCWPLSARHVRCRFSRFEIEKMYACIYFRDDFSIAVVVKNNENLSVYMESLLLLFLANFPDHHHFWRTILLTPSMICVNCFIIPI